MQSLCAIDKPHNINPINTQLKNLSQKSNDTKICWQSSPLYIPLTFTHKLTHKRNFNFKIKAIENSYPEGMIFLNCNANVSLQTAQKFDRPLSLKKNDDISLKNMPNLEYDPSFWNNNIEIKNSVNCYAYALNMDKIPAKMSGFGGTGGYGLQPGGASGLYLDTYNINAKDLIDYCKKDAEVTGGIFVEATAGEKPPMGGWKVALVYDIYGDYHFYRQHPDNTWSHKHGKEVSNLDSSRKIIKDPETCSKDYAYTHYTEFVGYFHVKPGNFENIKKPL